MSAPIAKSQFAFELPNLTYVDASQEEVAYRGPLPASKPTGLRALIAAFHAWREKQGAMAELDMMTDRELMDIGLNRSDVHRVFNHNFNSDLHQRTAA